MKEITKLSKSGVTELDFNDRTAILYLSDFGQVSYNL